VNDLLLWWPIWRRSIALVRKRTSFIMLLAATRLTFDWLLPIAFGLYVL
jgi:hypothetical protein